MTVQPLLFDLAYWGAQLGFHRLNPPLKTSEVITHGNLADEEKAIYRLLLARGTATKPMIREANTINANVKLVKTPAARTAFLLFTSNGQGTSFSKEKWHRLYQ